MIRSLFNKTWVRYLFIGGLSYVVEMITLFGLHYGLGASSLTSVAVSFIVGFFVAYVLQKTVTFRDNRRSKKVVIVQLTLYGALVAWNYVFTLLVVGLFENILSVILLRTIVIIITTIWNYVLYKKIFLPSAKVNPKKLAKILPQWLLRGSLFVLLASTTFWAILGARIQQANADQLVNSFLLQNPAVFHGSILPDAHSFLLKLPIFWFVQLVGADPFWFITVTVVLALATVAGLAYILSRIERRPVVLAVLFLALSLCLLLTPAEPAAGSLLPANFAMLTTRNIEYLVFILGLALLLKAPRLRSRSFIAACAVFCLLIVSDKLFFSLSIGGAILASLAYIISRRRQLLLLSLRWLAATAIGFGLAIAILGILNFTHLLQTAGSSGVGPYGIVSSPKEVISGIVYAVLGVFTNFGANPVVDINVIADLPKAIFGRVFSIATPAFLVTISIAVFALSAMFVTVKRSLKAIPTKNRSKKPAISQSALLSQMLVWSSTAMLGIFIVSNHYYPVDSRYLAIFLFAGFIALATRFRTEKLSRKRLYKIALVLVVAHGLAVPFVIAGFQKSIDANQEVSVRNGIVTKIVKTHPTTTLVGDYWRVMPIKLQTPTATVTPLESCTELRPILTSTAWQPDLHNHSFAYLLSLDTRLAGFPECKLSDITAAFGKPTSSALVRGTPDNPKELVLFYDAGIKPLTATQVNPTPDTVIPVNLAKLPSTPCDTTVMQFVAHQDDDILFMNPDLQRDIKAGNCIRTVYLTAGDSGSNDAYWAGRRLGAEDAYDAMRGNGEQVWVERNVQLPDGQFIVVANPKANKKISLIFLNLPDGNIDGKGFPSRNYESLSKLQSGRITQLNTVEDYSAYTSTQLIDGLRALMAHYEPTSIRSESSFTGTKYKDHPDHNTTAYYATTAYTQYIAGLQKEKIPSITHYLGYPVHALPENISPADFQEKAQVFDAFAKHDDALYLTTQPCWARSVYPIYLHRQYTNPN